MNLFTKKEQRVFITFLVILFFFSLAIFFKKTSFQPNLFFISSKEIKININTAGKKELDSLPYIGEVLCQRIIDYRLQKGDFKTKEEIMVIKGIGKKKFEKIKDLIKVK